MTSFIQRSFAGGLIAPSLFARADQTKYVTGAREMRNFIATRYGSAANRPGTRYVGETKFSTLQVRLVKFVFNASQTYVLEFGQFYVRIYQNGALLGPGSVTAWSNATNYTLGDLAANGGVNYYCIRPHLNQAPPNATYWYPMPAGVLEVPTPYTEAQVQALNYVQSADVVTIASKSHAPRQLRRESAIKWAFGELEIKPDVEPPTTVRVTAGTAGAKVWKYAVTAVTDRGVESLPGVSDSGTYPAKTITGASVIQEATTYSRGGRDGTVSIPRPPSYKVRIASAAHGFTSGMSVLINDVGGMVEINGRIFKITVIDANTFELDNTKNANKFGAYTGGGTATLLGGTATGGTPTAANPNVITWTSVVGAKEYNIYREENERMVFIGVSGGTRFEDSNLTANANEGVPYLPDLFNGDDDYPGTVAFAQQRLVFASTNGKPETVWMSRSGDYRNFTNRTPIQDDDAIQFTLVGSQVAEVRQVVEVGQLVVFTSTGEYTIQGDGDGVIRPTAINPKQDGYNGSANLRPIPIGNTALYVQARGAVVRDLRYEFQTSGYQGRDLTVYAPHLFDGFTLRDWDYQQIPHSVVWAVRSDGVMLGLTYVRDHDVWAWHQHDTDGIFEQVVSIPEGDEDFVYVVVKRTINGATKRYIERMATRRISNVATDARFLDSHLTFDGTNTGATTLTLSGGTTWAYTEDLTLTASVSQFIAGDVGNIYRLKIGTETLDCRVITYTSGTVVTVQAVRDVPVAFRGVATASWFRCVDDLTGLGHLEGKTVSILADGFVHPQRTVTGGAITLQRPYAVVHVGLPITADLGLLDLEVTQGETILDKRKRINKVTALVQETRAFLAGPDENNLREAKLRAGEDYADPITPVTGTTEVLLNGTWDDSGRVFIRNTDPLPVTVLAVIRQGMVS